MDEWAAKLPLKIFLWLCLAASGLGMGGWVFWAWYLYRFELSEATFGPVVFVVSAAISFGLIGAGFCHGYLKDYRAEQAARIRRKAAW